MSISITEDELFPKLKEFDIKQRLGEIVLVAKNIIMDNETAFRKITSLYSQAKDWENQIEFARKQANAPDQEKIRIRNDKAKELLDPLRQIQAIAKDKSIKYNLMLESTKILDEENEKPVLGDAANEKPLRGDGAIVYTRTVRKFRIVDESKIPAKYLKVDMEAIERDIALGIAEIPGVEVYQEKVVQLKKR